MSPTIFLSCVTNELGTLRTRLARLVQRSGFHARFQESFAQRGIRTLPALAEEIRASDAVTHILGAQAGAPAPAAQVEEFLQLHPKFLDQFPQVASEGQKGQITYTHWEAWFALFFGKRLFPYLLQNGTMEPAQQLHHDRLVQHKRYPKAVNDELALVEEVLISLRECFPHAPGESLTTELLKASPCNLPYSSLGEGFVGRGQFMQDLRQRFENARHLHSTTWPNQSITGMPGVGKTRLAVEYGWGHKNDYSALLFINTESKESLERGLANLSEILPLELPLEAPDPHKRAAVLDWLKGHPGWLLVLDNVDDETARNAVDTYLKHLHAGHVLITGRWIHWSNDVQRLSLHVLSREDASTILLATTTDRLKQENDLEVALALADDLGGLCLALEQCSAYVNRLAISLAEYRLRWRENAKKVRDWADKVLMKYHEEKDVSLSVATTWQVTIDQLSRSARILLQVLCWLAPHPIPSMVFESLQKQKTTRFDVEEAAAELRRYSLLQRPRDRSGAGPDEMHRLEQLITRDRLTDGERKESLAGALASLNSLFVGDPNDVRTWPVLNQLAEHVAVVVAHADNLGVTGPTSRLMHVLGTLYDAQNRSSEAEKLYRDALAIVEKSTPKDLAIIAAIQNNLGEVLHATNRLKEAEHHLGIALSINEGLFGPEHPNVAKCLNNLASLLQDMNRIDEAVLKFDRALTILEKSPAEYNSTLASALNNLAYLLQTPDRAAEAELLMRRALALNEQFFGEKHPNIAFDLRNLAWMLQGRNQWADAEPLLRRALFIDEQFFGKEHPRVLRNLNQLALVLVATNRSDKAETLITQALDISKQGYCENDFDVARDLNDLASLLHSSGRLPEAEPLMRRAVEVSEKHFGKEHPEFAKRLNNLAMMLQDMHRLEEAEQSSRSAVTILLEYARRSGRNDPLIPYFFENFIGILKNLARTDAEIQFEIDKLKAGIH